MSETYARTPLYDAHVRAGGKIVSFAGFEMPVQYVGVTAESKAVRSGVGMFDVSHMARLRVFGTGAEAFLERVTTNDVARLEDGRGQYSLLTNEEGGVVDDLIVYRLGDERFSLVVNAGNHAKDVAWLGRHKPASVTMLDDTAKTAMIAVQGPRAAETLAGMVTEPDELRALPLFGTLSTNVLDIPIWVARSGYTGEDGFEVVPRAEDAERLWDALLAAGVAPCGLGARDALRVEAGLPLYGHELADDLSPIAAGLGWVVGKTKSFLGSEPIARDRREGTATKLQGIRLEAKRLLVPGTRVFLPAEEGGELVGEVTSGVVAPLLEVGIAMAYVRADVKPERAVEVEIRSRREPARLVSKRFLAGRVAPASTEGGAGSPL